MPKSETGEKRHFKPITGDAEILQMIHSFTGKKKLDDQVGIKYGLSKFQVSVLRQVFGKTEYETQWHPKEMKEAVVGEYEDGIPTPEIARKHSITVGSVYGILESMGVDRNRRDFWQSKFTVKRLLDLRDRQHLTWGNIGKIMGRTLKCCQAKYSHIKKMMRIIDMRDKQNMQWEDIAKVIGVSAKYCQEQYEELKQI